MLTIRLDPEIEKRLRALGKKNRRTKTFYARVVIIEHPEDMEAVYLAEERPATLAGTLSMKEMRNALGLQVCFFILLSPFCSHSPCT